MKTSPGFTHPASRTPTVCRSKLSLPNLPPVHVEKQLAIKTICLSVVHADSGARLLSGITSPPLTSGYVLIRCIVSDQNVDHLSDYMYATLSSQPL